MTKLLAFCICLLTGALMVMGLEVRAVRSDQQALMSAYGEFLAKKVGGKPLSAHIKPGSLAVFKSNQGVLACGVMH